LNFSITSTRAQINIKADSCKQQLFKYLKSFILVLKQQGKKEQVMPIGEDINRAWENIKENITTSDKKSLGLHELKQRKPWFDEECFCLLDQRKQAKMQWLQDPNQSNVDNLHNVRREATIQFRNKNKEYLKS